MRRLVTSIFLASSVFFASPTDAQQQEKRIALVIGNTAYQAEALPTAANDAGLIAQSLQAAGFDVLGARDLDQDTLRRTFRDFLDKAAASGPDTVALRHPWRQMMHVDVLASAFGVSVMLLAYYTAVGFGLIYLVTVYQFSVTQANALANWTWGSNAIALIVAGVNSDRLRARKPFMLAGGIGGAV